MKNLANCTGREFLAQSVKIKKAVKGWLDITKVLEIRKKKPADLPEVTEEMTEEEKKKVINERREKVLAQAYQNVEEMFDAVAEEHPDETLEVLALCCFIKPEEVDNYPMTYYLTSIREMAENEDVKAFFSWLMRSGLMDTLTQ